MNFISGKYTVLLFLSQRTISSNTQLIANVFLEKFETKYKKYLEKNVIIDHKMGDVVELLQDVMENVQT
jgi:hypothetical protein